MLPCTNESSKQQQTAVVREESLHADGNVFPDAAAAAANAEADANVMMLLYYCNIAINQQRTHYKTE